MSQDDNRTPEERGGPPAPRRILFALRRFVDRILPARLLTALGGFAQNMNLFEPKKWSAVNWVLIAAVVLFVVVFSNPSYDGSAPVSATAVDGAGESGEVSVRLSGVRGLSADEIEARVRFEPTVAFTVTKVGSGEALITLIEPKNLGYTGTFDRGNGQEPYMFSANGRPLSVYISNYSASIHPQTPITLVFSEQVDIYSLERHLRVDPRAGYTLSYDAGQVTIYPETEWARTDNAYLRIDAGYTSANGRQFSETQVLKFRVSGKSAMDPYVHFATENNYVLSPDKDMTLIFFGENLKEQVPVVVETYRVPSLEKYREQGHIYLRYDVNLNTLEKLDTNVYLIGNEENRLTVPSPGEGCYIVSATYTDPYTDKETEVRTSYFFTPLSVYMQSSNRETLIWLNSAASGAPLSGYEVVFDAFANHRGITNREGLLILPHETFEDEPDPVKRDKLMERNNNPAFSVYAPNGSLVYYDDTDLQMATYHEERYYSYFFIDRTLYRPEDTICFWGYISSFRYNEHPLPESVTVHFDPDGLDIAIEAKISANGTFEGEILLERIRSSQYYITAEIMLPIEGEGAEPVRHTFETAYVSVKEFEKPSYVLSSRTDKDFYTPRDTVTVTTSAAFYDGTPLPFYDLEIGYYDDSTYNWVQLGTVTTDARGDASFSFPASKGGSSTGSGKSLYWGRYMVRIASDGEQINHVQNYRYFPSDVLTEYTITRESGKSNLTLTVRAYEMNFESPALLARLADISDSYYDYLSEQDLLALAKGDPVDVDLDIALRWHYMDMKKIRHQNRNTNSSSYYIPFTNSYSLDQVPTLPAADIITSWENSEKCISVTTKNGVAVVEDLIFLPEGSFIDFEEWAVCRAEIGYKDNLKNSCEAYAYYPDYSMYESMWWRWADEDEPIPGYSFVITDLATGSDLSPTSRYSRTVDMPAETTAHFDLRLDGEPVTTSGRILYSIIQDGLYSNRIVAANSFDLPYLLSYGRNVQLVAIYFDGRQAHYVQQLNLQANDDSLSIDIEVTPDRESYRPGDTVTLQVKATDLSGRGVAGNLCVSVVDESIFALSEQYISVLYDLYSDVSYTNNYVYQYCTTYRHESPPGNMLDGGKGGGDGVEFYDSYRSNFKDTALFFPTTTDASGSAAIRFVLPDNTTSWRITAVEVGRNLKAGQSKSNIIASLPFFIKPVVTSKYIEGDDIAMLVQGHGTLLKEGDEITYTVQVTGDGIDETQTTEGLAYEAVQLNFGKLPMGTYKVIAKAQYSGYSDTVELPVSVMKSNLELVIHKRIAIAETLDISAVRFPVTITMYDEENEAFLTSINSLFGHYCMQASQRLSRFVAKKVIRETVSGEADVPYYIAKGNDSASDMQNADGGIAFYPGGDSEPQVTAYVLLVAEDQFNLTQMSRYFKEQLDDLPAQMAKDRAACMLGLAAIGDITAKELTDALEAGSTLDVKAYFIAGLAYLGEEKQAAELYEKHLAAHVKTLDSRGRSTEWERDTAAIWIAASRLGHADADRLSIYFGSSVWRFRTLFECMIYAVNYDRPVTPIRVGYSIKGVEQTKDLGFGGMGTLVLSKSELETLRFTSYPDSLKAVAYYVGEPEEMGLEQSENMSIKKGIEAVDAHTYKVTLTIHLSKDAPTGQYDISDWIPSNTRLYKRDDSYTSEDSYVYFDVTQEGQKLYVAFDNNYVTRDRTIHFTYLVRQTFDSEAVLDTTYMIHGNSGENCHTEKSVFEPGSFK